MRLKIKIYRDIHYNLIVLILLAMYIFAFANILYWQTDQAEIWERIYKVALLAMFILDCAYITIHLTERRGITGFYTAVFLFLLYETMVSFVTQFYNASALVLDGYTWPLTFVVFYMYAKYTDIEKIIHRIKKIVIVGSAICMALLVNNIKIHLMGTQYDPYGGIVGPVYFCLSLLGLILLVGTKKEKVVFSIVGAALILWSSKRTGALIVGLGLCGYYLVGAHIEKRMTKRAKKYFQFIIIVIFALIVGIWFINKFDILIIDRFINVIDDQGSGRINAWTKVIYYFDQSDYLNKIIGHGFHAVPYEVQPLGRAIYAHNSYLEFLYDFGWVGLSWLIGIIIYLVAKMVQVVKAKYAYASVLVYSMVEIVLLSLVGYFFDESRFILPVVMLWGICLGSFSRDRMKDKKKK